MRQPYRQVIPPEKPNPYPYATPVEMTRLHPRQSRSAEALGLSFSGQRKRAATSELLRVVPTHMEISNEDPSYYRCTGLRRRARLWNPLACSSPGHA